MIRTEEMVEKVCENCRHSRPLTGLDEPAFICDHKALSQGNWCLVDEDASCPSFEFSREIVTAEIAAALAEGAKLLPLTQDKFAIVDAEDYERLREYKWHAIKNGQRYYAKSNRLHVPIAMHRLILNAPSHLVVDHINHNGLDNRRSNLRLCTVSQNNRNRRPITRPNKGSKYKGVSFDKKRNLFKAVIWRNKKQCFLGRFKSQIKAAKAYDKKARELFGQFAYLNFPDCHPALDAGSRKKQHPGPAGSQSASD